jgi:hypothetical protein
MQRVSIPFREPLIDLTKWRAQYVSQPEAPADSTLLAALQAFQVFAKDYQAYFEDLIQQGQLDPAQTTLFRVREQVENALEDYRAPLERVAMQRQIAGYREELDAATTETMRYLDKLKVAQEVLVYFDKVSLIQQLPYTAIPIIGIPYRLMPLRDGAGQDGDWMAIPHELGHYVFWHLAKPVDLARRQQQIAAEVRKAAQQALTGQLADEALVQGLADMIAAWTEEIFSDVIGVCLSGEAFVDSLMGLIKRSIGNREELKTSDVEHPHLCLRPIIRLAALSHYSTAQPALDLTAKQAGWNTFFQEILGVNRLGQLRLRANPPTPLADPAKLNKAEALTVLSGKATMDFSIAQIRPALIAVVDTLCQIADQILQSGLQGAEVDPARAFEELRTGYSDLQTLLRPQKLEGGNQHGHGAWVWEGHAFWTWHDCGVHNH